jgi:hypothetical protein
MLSEKVTVAAILAVALIASTSIYVYFSPFQTCLRGGPRTTEGQPNVAWCTRANGGWGSP